MNRVYKVIWSKAKHCYVVTSEIAKSHTKGESTGRGLKKLAAALLVAAALMGPNFAWAAGDTVTVKDTTEVEQIVYTQKGADDQFATKTDLAAKANAADVENTYAKTADVANTYVNKTDAQVTNLTVYRDVEAYGNLQVGNGNFTVNGITGNVTTGYATIGDDLTVKGDTEMKGDLGVNGNIKTNRGFIQTGGGNINTQGGALRTNGGNINAGNGTITGNKLTDGVASLQNGNLTTTGNINTSGTVTGGTVASTGNISAVGDIHANGAITGASASFIGDIHANGAIQGKSISDGTATMQNGNLTGVKNLSAETITTHGDLTVNGKLNMDEIDMTKVGKVDDNNVTASTNVAAGEITSYKKATSTKDGSEKESAIDYDEKGTSTWAVATDAHKKWNKSTLTVEGSDVKSEVVDSEKNSNLSTQLSYQTTEEMSRADGKTASYLRGAVEEKSELTDGDKKTTIDTLADHTITNIKYGANESIDLQQADQIGSSVTDGTNTTVVNQNAGSLIFSITDGPNNTGVTQTAKDITNTAKNGTIANEAKDITNHASENMTNTVDKDLTTTVGGEMKTTVTGNVTEDYQSDLDTTVGGEMKTTVTGNVTEDYQSDLDTTVGGEMKTTVTGKVTEDYQSDLDTTVGGEMKTTVTGKVTEDYQSDLDTTVGGDSSLSAENIHNTATKALTNEAETITNKAHESVTTQIGEGTAVKSVMDVKGIANTATGRAITNDAQTITNTGIASVTNQVSDNKVLVDTNQVKSAFGDTIYTTWDAYGITNTAGNNTVISDNDGTTFANEDAKTPFEEGGKTGTRVNTKITGNKVETGKVLTDFAEVANNLDVGGDLNVAGNIETHDAVLSADSRQVVTGRQLYQTNERVDRLDNRIKKVGANAAALAALRPGDFNPDDKFSIAAGFGSYRNANAAALGLFYRPNENVLLSLGTSFGDGENMVNAGVSVKFGRGKSMAERRKEMADEVSSMRDEMRSQDERIAELEEMLKKQSELIEKLSKES